MTHLRRPAGWISSVASTSCDPPGRLGWAVAGVLAVLALVNVIDASVAHASLVLGPAGAAGLLAIARWAGLSWPELCPGTGAWRRGPISGAGPTAAVGLRLAAVAAPPPARDRV